MSRSDPVAADPPGAGLRSRATLAAVAVTGLGMFPPWLTGALAVQIQADLRFGSSELGIAVAAFAMVSALASMPAGRLVQRRGWRFGSLATIGLIGVTMLGIALLARSWLLLVALLAVGGLGSALSSPAANLGLARAVRPDRRGLAFGLKQAAVPASTLLAGLAVPAVALTVGWRWAFVIAAVVAAALTTAVPRHGLRPSGGPKLREAPAGLGPLLVLAVGAGLGTASTNSLGAFLVVATVHRGLDPQVAGTILAAGGALSVIVRIASGWAADRREGAHFAVVGGMMAVGAIGLVGLAFADAAVPIAVATALAFGVGWSWNGLFDFALVRRLPESPAAATGVAQTGKYVGAVVGPLTFGFVADDLGFPFAWLGAAVVLVLAAGTVLVGRRLLRARLSRAGALPPAE